LPETNDHASFFSFFDVTEKIAIVGGTFAYGMVEQLTGSMRISALVLMVFFIGGALMMIPLLNRKSLKALEPLT
jgi:UMF1 family MFS transporter